MDLKMEVYSPALELLGVLEVQRSAIWESRAFSSGSFSVESLITDESRALLVPENIVWIEGETAGIIEHVQREARREGPYITAKGRDLTGILDRRILWGRYDLYGAVPDLMRQLVDDCCIHPTQGDLEARVIPGLALEDAAPASGEKVRKQQTGGTLLEALEELGEAYQVAFGVRFNPEVPRMEFWARYGVDRSTGQTDNEPIFYSTELDDVLTSDYTYDSNNYRNVTLVAGEGEGADRVSVTVQNPVESEPAPQPPTPPVVVEYTISLNIDPAGGGVVTGGGTVQEGVSVTVTAAPSSGYAFVGWQENGAIVSTEATYTFQANADRTLTAVFADMSPKEYEYSGNVVAATLYPGVYKLEVWGAEGGYRSGAAYAGKGGYSVGNLTVAEPTQVFVRVGGSGNTGGTAGGFNGGGRRGTYNGGGGASDIRIGADDLNHRVIVAGGGGSDGAADKNGMYGGGEAGGSASQSYGTGGFGGTQTGVSNSAWQTTAPSTNTASQAGAYAGFGFGGNGISTGGGHGGAGGGGWYGGSGSVPDSSSDDDRGGGGGSGFVWTGQNAPAGFGLTAVHHLSNARTVNGAQSFTSPGGTAETGHSGNGYARITPVVSYTVVVVSQDAEKGTVSGGGSFEGGSQVTVTATPASGYKLSSWQENGHQVSTSASYTFTVTGNRTLTAVFEEVLVYTVTTSVDPSGTGTASGAGTYQEGQSVTVTAAPGSGYKFVAWKVGGSTVSESTSYTFTATGNVALVAVFTSSRLPTGYTEVEYVHFPGNSAAYFSYAIPSHTASVAPSIEMDIKLGTTNPGTSRIVLLISYPSGAVRYFSLTTAGSSSGFTGLRCPASSTNNTMKVLNVSANQKVHVEIDNLNKVFKVGNNSAAIGGWSFSTSSTTGYSSPLGRSTASYVPEMWVYEYKYYQHTQNATAKTLVQHWVPCIRTSDNAVGFYDLVKKTFTANSGSGTIDAGPAV